MGAAGALRQLRCFDGRWASARTSRISLLGERGSSSKWTEDYHAGREASGCAERQSTPAGRAPRAAGRGGGHASRFGRRAPAHPGRDRYAGVSADRSRHAAARHAVTPLTVIPTLAKCPARRRRSRCLVTCLLTQRPPSCIRLLASDGAQEQSMRHFDDRSRTGVRARNARRAQPSTRLRRHISRIRVANPES